MFSNLQLPKLSVLRKLYRPVEKMMQRMEDPHFIIKVESSTKTQLLEALANQSVLLYYDRKWCSFQYKIISTREEATPLLYLAIKVDNAFLHVGQFKPGQSIELYRAGRLLSSGTIEKVMDTSMNIWNEQSFSNTGPAKEGFKKPEIERLFQNWKEALKAHQINAVYTDIKTETPTFTILQDRHTMMSLARTQQVVEVVKDNPYSTYYKIDYLPLAYGTIDLFLKDLNLTYAIISTDGMVTGNIIVKKMTLSEAS